MNTLLDRLNTFIIDGDLKPQDSIMLDLVAKRLEHFEFTDPVARDARLGERIEALEAELKVANDCRVEAVRGAEVMAELSELRGDALHAEQGKKRPRDTRKGEWPQYGQRILRWSATIRDWIPETSSDNREAGMLWLPAPPPPPPEES